MLEFVSRVMLELLCAFSFAERELKYSSNFGLFDSSAFRLVWKNEFHRGHSR